MGRSHSSQGERSQVQAPRRRTERKRSSSPKHSQQRGRQANRGDLPPPSLEDPGSSAGGVLARRGQVLRAVELASNELTPEELAALDDPGFRQQAARWRSGSGSRRVSAAFARLLTSLYTIFPGWATADGLAQSAAPPIVEALPFDQSSQPSLRVWWLRFSMGWQSSLRWMVSYRRTLWALLLLLLFPRVVAALIATVVRLFIRLMLAITTRLLRDLWLELGGVVNQLSSVSQGVETALMSQLEQILVDWWPPATSQPSLQPADPPAGTPAGASVPLGGGLAPPPSPLFTNLLLAANLFFQVRAHRRGGVA